jgi:hypothetical protein
LKLVGDHGARRGIGARGAGTTRVGSTFIAVFERVRKRKMRGEERRRSSEKGSARRVCK